jgi:hypothetical protein
VFLKLFFNKHQQELVSKLWNILARQPFLLIDGYQFKEIELKSGQENELNFDESKELQDFVKNVASLRRKYEISKGQTDTQLLLKAAGLCSR